MRVKAISCSLGLLLGQLLGQSAQKSKQIVSGTQRHGEYCPVDLYKPYQRQIHHGIANTSISRSLDRPRPKDGIA
jgi:hypothetical protein